MAPAQSIAATATTTYRLSSCAHKRVRRHKQPPPECRTIGLVREQELPHGGDQRGAQHNTLGSLKSMQLRILGPKLQLRADHLCERPASPPGEPLGQLQHPAERGRV